MLNRLITYLPYSVSFFVSRNDVLFSVAHLWIYQDLYALSAKLNRPAAWLLHGQSYCQIVCAVSASAWSQVQHRIDDPVSPDLPKAHQSSTLPPMSRETGAFHIVARSLSLYASAKKLHNLSSSRCTFRGGLGSIYTNYTVK